MARRIKRKIRAKKSKPKRKVMAKPTVKRKRKTKVASTKKRTSKPNKNKTPRRRAKFKVPKKWVLLSPKEIDNDNEAESRIGKKNIKKGSRRIGTTKFLSPNKRGFGTLKRIIRKVTKPKDFARFSYHLRIEFNGRKGKKVRINTPKIGIPKYSPKNRARVNKRRARRKLPALNRDEFFEYLIYNKIRRLIFGAIRQHWGTYPSKQKQLTMTKTQLNKMRSDIKRQDASFQFTLNRES